MINLYTDLQLMFDRHGINIDYKDNWNHVTVPHNEDFNPAVLKFLRQSFQGRKVCGIYIYTFNDDGITRVLYVGKSQDIAGRLWNHYRERHELTGAANWRHFWSSHKREMKVYYKEIFEPRYGEPLRIIAERYLITELRPISELYYKSVK